MSVRFGESTDVYQREAEWYGSSVKFRLDCKHSDSREQHACDCVLFLSATLAAHFGRLVLSRGEEQ